MPRKAYASVATPRLYEEIPDRNQQAVMSAIYTNRNIANSILMASLTGSVAAARKMERYSRSENFFYGAPRVFTSLDNVETTEIWLRFLQNKYSPGTGEFFRVTQVGLVEPGDRRRIDVHGYILLQANPIVSPDTFSRFEYAGNVARIFKNTPTGEVLHVEETSPIVTGGIEHYVFWAWFEPGANGPQLRTEGAEVYNESSGSMPELHDVGEPPPPLNDEMLPLVPIRIDGEDYDSEGNGLEGSDSIRHMLRRGNLDPDDLVEAIKSNENEDKIDDAYVGFGISITEEDEWAIAGLAATFSSWYDSNPDTEAIFAADSIRQNINITVEAPSGLNMILTYNWIRKTILQGEPGYTKTFTQGTQTEACFAPDVEGDPPVCSNTSSTNEYRLTRPIPGTDTYEEIIISGLVLLHNVYVEELDLDRDVAITDDVPEMVIPLFENIIRDVPNRLREDLVFGSMRLYIYAIEIVNLSWYETGIFKAILVIVSIILAFFTYGATLVATLAVSTAVAFLIVVAAVLVVNYAVQWLAEEIGGVAAAILVIAATFFLGGGGFNFSTLSTTLNTAGYALFTSAIKIYSAYTTDQFNDIVEETEAFEQDYEKRIAELEAAQEALDYGEALDLVDIVESRSIPNTDINESPQAFYDRTSTTVDLAALSSSLVDDFYAANVLLPEVDSYLPSQNF